MNHFHSERHQKMLKNMLSDFFSTQKEHPVRTEGKTKYILEHNVTKGRLPFHTASISLKAYPDDSKSLRLPLKIKWYRYVAERHYEIEELEDSEVYDFSSMDIGCEIKAVVKPIEGSELTKTSLTIGPIRCDPNIRPPLESVLLSGFSKFNVVVDEEEKEDDISPDKGQPISVFISQNQIKFFYYTDNEEESFYLELNSEKPVFEAPPNEIEKVKIKFDEVCLDNGKSAFLDTEKSNIDKSRGGLKKKIYKSCSDGSGLKYEITLRFFSRNSRDIFLISCRLFRIVPVVALSNLFRQIDVLLRENRLFDGTSSVTMNDLLVEHDMLRSLLLNSIQYVKEQDKEKDELQECVIILEKDLKTSIDEFRRLLNENMSSESPPEKKKKALDQLNASLISVREDYKDMLGRRLDLSSSHIRGLRGSTTNQVPPTNLLTAEGIGISKEEYDRVVEELERVRKTRDIMLKELNSIKDKKKQRKVEMQKTLSEMSMRMEKVNKEMSRANDSIISKDRDMDSRLFNFNDMSAIQIVREEPGEYKGIKKMLETPFDDSVLNEVDASLNKVTNLERKIQKKDVELAQAKSAYNNLQIKLAQAEHELEVVIRKQKEKEMLSTSPTFEEIEKLKIKNDSLANEIKAIQQDLNSSETFAINLRAGIKEIASCGKYTGCISELESVAAISNEGKIKLLNLENEGLQRRVSSLRSELTMLRSEVNILRTPKEDPLSVKMNVEMENLQNENQSLRRLLEDMKKLSKKEDLNTVVEGLKLELKKVKELNATLQKPNTNNNESSQHQLLIDQLQSTNERLMQEVFRLQEQLQNFEEARASFISDSMNDSYMSNSLTQSFIGKGKNMR